MESLKIILMAVAAAVLYGIMHDQITARVCVEYFTIGHPQLFVFPTDDPTLLGIGWGIVATWWVGLPLGIALDCCPSWYATATCGSLISRSYREVTRCDGSFCFGRRCLGMVSRPQWSGVPQRSSRRSLATRKTRNISCRPVCPQCELSGRHRRGDHAGRPNLEVPKSTADSFVRVWINVPLAHAVPLHCLSLSIAFKATLPSAASGFIESSRAVREVFTQSSIIPALEGCEPQDSGLRR